MVVTAIVVTLVVVLFTLAVTHRNWAALRVKRLDQGLDHLAKFERATMQLIKDESLPDPVVEMLGVISKEIGRPRLAMWVVAEILSGRLSNAPKAISDRARDLRKSLDQLTEPQLHLLAECIAHGLMISASSHPFIASYLQRAVFFTMFVPNSDRVDDGDKARAIIVDYGIRRAPEVNSLELVAA